MITVSKTVLSRAALLLKLAITPIAGVILAGLLAPESSDKFLLRAIGLSVGLLLSFIWLASEILEVLRKEAVFLPRTEDHELSDTGLVNDMNLFLIALVDERPPSRGLLASCAAVAVKSLRQQVESKSVTILTQDIAESQIHSIILHAARRARRVVGTCLTTMDDFWCNNKTGPSYLRLNWEIAKRTGVPVERIMKISNYAWKAREIKKRELIRILLAQGWPCYTIDEKEFANPDLEEQDLFLLLDEKNNPLLGMEWALDSSGTPSSITLTLSPGQLAKLFQDFQKMESRALSLDPGDVALETVPRDIDRAASTLRNLCGDRLGENSIHYLRTPTDDPTQIADYWNGLEGTLLRPSPVTLEWIGQSLHNQSNEAGLRKVAVLGCTPEVRALLCERFREVEVFVVDLSQKMYDGTSYYLTERRGLETRNEHFLLMNWLSMANYDFKVDAVVGVDVINMIAAGRGRDTLRRFMQSVESILRAGGVFLTQAVCAQDGSGAQFSYIEMYEKLDQIVESLLEDGLSAHEVFAELAFALMRTRERGECILDLPATYDLITSFISSSNQYKEFSRKIYETYSSCNSRLTLILPHEFEDTLPKGMAMKGSYRRANVPEFRFTKSMFLFSASRIDE